MSRSKFDPLTLGLFVLGVGSLGYAARPTGSRAALPPGFKGFKGFDGFDDFDNFDDGPGGGPASTRADLFRDSVVGHVFAANGRQYRVVNDPYTKPGHRIVRGHPAAVVRDAHGRLVEEEALYAALEGDTLVAHKLAKRGAFAPIGRPVWREDMSGPASGGANRVVKVGAPSAASLTRKLAIPADKAAQIADLMRGGHVVPALRAASDAMKAYGLKVVDGKEDRPGRFTGLEYVDRADAWRDTLIYDYGRDTFLIAPWGPTVDANPTRF